MNIRFSIEAVEELESLQDHIAKADPEMSSMVGHRILASIEILRRFPYAGHIGRRKGTRELTLPRLPYIAVYKIVKNIGSPKYVALVTIIHRARDRM